MRYNSARGYRGYYRGRRYGHLRLTQKRLNSTAIPDSMFVKLKYYDQQSTAGNSTDPYQAAFRGNSIYDPEAATGGDTVVGYPEWLGFYNEYSVKASKITVTAHNLSTSFDDVLAVFPTPLQEYNASMDAPLREPQSQPRVKTKTVYMKGSTREIQTISYYMTTSKAFQRPLSNLGTDVNGSFGANPAAQWYWNLQWNLTDNVVGHSPASFEIKITYYVQLLRPDTQLASDAL